jgi:hypothetical protein
MIQCWNTTKNKVLKRRPEQEGEEETKINM